jgi:hypothetical protein
MSAADVIRKIDQTRASIEALKRQADGVARQIEIQQIKLQAYLELDKESRVKSAPKKSKQKKPANPGLFTPSLPWDRIFAAIHEAVGDKDFGTADVNLQLATIKREAPPTTVRSKLRNMANRKTLIRVGVGRYRFPAVAKKQAA